MPTLGPHRKGVAGEVVGVDVTSRGIRGAAMKVRVGKEHTNARSIIRGGVMPGRDRAI